MPATTCVAYTIAMGERVSQNAPGQLLGYTIQYPRALCHLLKASPGGVVCIEVHGDVSTIRPNGTVIAEEDKSSLSSNPVTDKSSDLWKTLSNWVNSIKAGELDLDKTEFILYRNRSGREGIADSFSAAESEDAAVSALGRAKELLSDVGAEHPIFPYLDNCLQNESILLQLIRRFSLETGAGAGYEQVRDEVKKKHLPRSQIDLVVTSINGWIVKYVTEAIAAGSQAIIRWEDFDDAVKAIFSMARRMELIDFTISSPPTVEDVQCELASSPIYVRQVQLVTKSSDEAIRAVTDYLRAQTNRYKWIEDEVIDEALAEDFEDRLTRFWENSMTRFSIAYRSFSKEDRGELVRMECMNRRENIRGEDVPASTVAGTYHALADEPVIGWHDDWKSEFKK